MRNQRSSETSIHTRSTWAHIPENDILHNHSCKNLKSYISLFFEWPSRIWSCYLYLFIHSFIHQWLYIPFVGPWPLLYFRNHFYTDGRTLWTSDQTLARPLPTHRTVQHRKSALTDIHVLSGIQTHDH
jgi:hypothetical protein